LNAVESEAWRPQIRGWSHDILPWYRRVAEDLPEGARTVEIGVFHGRSLIFLAEELARLGKRAEVWGIDPLEAHWPEPGMSSWAAFVKHLHEDCSPEARERIRVIRATSEALVAFRPASLDLVFVDGRHEEPGVREDITLALPRLRPGAILAGHDYSEQFDGVRRAVRALLPSDVQVHGTVWSWRKAA